MLDAEKCEELIQGLNEWKTFSFMCKKFNSNERSKKRFKGEFFNYLQNNGTNKWMVMMIKEN